MVDPVIVAETGHTYERSAIDQVVCWGGIFVFYCVFYNITERECVWQRETQRHAHTHSPTHTKHNPTHMHSIQTVINKKCIFLFSSYIQDLTQCMLYLDLFGLCWSVATHTQYGPKDKRAAHVKNSTPSIKVSWCTLLKLLPSLLTLLLLY